MDNDFADFKRPVKIYRINSSISQANDETFGHKVESVEMELTINAIYQPANADEVMNLPEGRTYKQALKMYCDEKLTIADFENNDAHNSDLVLINRKIYEVLAKKEYQQNVINHYEYILILSDKEVPTT